MDSKLPTVFTLGEATSHILRLKSDMSQNIIELGKWISATKAKIPRGEWMDWLKYEVKIPYTTAWRFMKVYNEVDAETLERVGFRKVVDILELPPSKFREDLMDLAPAMTTRHIESVKREVLSPEETTEIFEAVLDQDGDVDTALESNAVLLDALYRISIADLTDVPKELLNSQLRNTPQKVDKFLEGLKDGSE